MTAASLIRLLTALTTLAPPPPGEGGGARDRAPAPPVDGRSERSHTEQAHQQLRMDIRVKLVPNLRSYEAIGSDVAEGLSFVDTIKSATDRLDSLRKGIVARSIENTVPGFRWITTSWDSLIELRDHIGTVRERLVELERISSELLQAADRYTADPGDEHFLSLMRGYEDATKVFEEARQAFEDLDKLLASTLTALGHTQRVVDLSAKIPWIGGLVEGLQEDLAGLMARMNVLRRIVAVASEATIRDERALGEIRARLQEAHAHDSYDAAGVLYADGKPGSALAAFREVRNKWPDTQWAHRSDRRIVDIVAFVDRMHEELRTREQETTTLREELARKPRVEVRTVEVEKTRLVTETKRVQAAAWPWALGGTFGGVLLSLLIVAAVLHVRRRRSADAPPP